MGLEVQRQGWSIQSTLAAVAIVITLGGICIGAYWNMMQVQAAQQATIESIKARLDISEKQIQLRSEADDRFASEMRTALAQINSGIADLRVLEATGKGLRK